MNYPAKVAMLTRLDRLSSSVNGNPKYKVMIGGDIYRTPTDAGWVYALHSGMVGKQCAYETKGKIITGLELAK